MRNGFDQQDTNGIPIPVGDRVFPGEHEDDDVARTDTDHFRLADVEPTTAGHMDAQWRNAFAIAGLIIITIV